MQPIGGFMTTQQAGSMLGRFTTMIPVNLIGAGATPEAQGKIDAKVNESRAVFECFLGLGNHPSVKLYGWRFCYDHGWMPV